MTVSTYPAEQSGRVFLRLLLTYTGCQYVRLLPFVQHLYTRSGLCVLRLLGGLGRKPTKTRRVCHAGACAALGASAIAYRGVLQIALKTGQTARQPVTCITDHVYAVQVSYLLSNCSIACRITERRFNRMTGSLANLGINREPL